MVMKKEEHKVVCGKPNEGQVCFSRMIPGPKAAADGQHRRIWKTASAQAAL